MKMANREPKMQISLLAWLRNVVVGVGLCSLIPVGVVLLARWMGVYTYTVGGIYDSPSEALRAFTGMLGLALTAGAVLAYKFGVFQRDASGYASDARHL
jgi:hypothetical protein